MKNISLTINPNAITSLSPPPAFPGPPIPKTISVTLSVQFDTEVESLKFTNNLLGFLAGDNE